MPLQPNPLRAFRRLRLRPLQHPSRRQLPRLQSPRGRRSLRPPGKNLASGHVPLQRQRRPLPARLRMQPLHRRLQLPPAVAEATELLAQWWPRHATSRRAPAQMTSPMSQQQSPHRPATMLRRRRPSLRPRQQRQLRQQRYRWCCSRHGRRLRPHRGKKQNLAQHLLMCSSRGNSSNWPLPRLQGPQRQLVHLPLPQRRSSRRSRALLAATALVGLRPVMTAKGRGAACSTFARSRLALRTTASSGSCSA
mmetsp:Transcript_28739/g.76044  ORF Transcript_28739/g.76044 Transcript_28739/m.76044 type:complete len:250 (+) Transcript_28739:376-1125(+)